MNSLYVIGKGPDVPNHIELHDDGRLDLVFIVLPDVSCDISLKIDILGMRAEVTVSGIYICNSDERVNIRIEVNHKVGGSSSNQILKGVVGGKAKTDFYGKITVDPDAQKTEAYQSNNNILLSDEAVVGTMPQLEIYADDVKCSHGATIGRLNEDELFYMRSRGITEDRAKVLQILSFISPVMEKVDDENVRGLIENAVYSL